MDCEIDESIDELTPTADYIDPERPVDSVEMSRKLVPIDEPKSPKKTDHYRRISIIGRHCNDGFMEMDTTK